VNNKSHKQTKMARRRFLRRFHSRAKSEETGEEMMTERILLQSAASQSSPKVKVLATQRPAHLQLKSEMGFSAAKDLKT